MMSLRARLALSKVALHARADQLDVEHLAPVILAGVDLLVLGSSGDKETDAGTVRAFRDAFAHTQLLLATDNGDAAELASADVVHLERPGWKLWGSYPKGHEWTLLGRGARDARTVRKPGDDWDYLFVGPLAVDDVDSRILVEAVTEQKPFAADTLPWFALCGFTLESVPRFVKAGARRIALTGDALESGDPVALVSGIKAVLNEAWEADEDSKRYRMSALAF